MGLYCILLQPSLFPVYSTRWTGAILYLLSALWSFLYFFSTAIHAGTLEKPYKLEGMPSYGQQPRARGANRMVTLFMLRDNPTLDSWPFPLLNQTRISLFGRALPWHLSLCVLTHEMPVPGLACVLLRSHVRHVATVGRPEADAQSHRCRGVPHLVLQTASQEGEPPPCGTHSVWTGTNKDNFSGNAAASLAGE